MGPHGPKWATTQHGPQSKYDCVVWRCHHSIKPWDDAQYMWATHSVTPPMIWQPGTSTLQTRIPYVMCVYYMAHMYGHRTHWYLSVLVLGLRYLRCWTPFVVSTCWLWGRCVFALRRNMSHKQYCSDLFHTLRLTHRFSSCFRLSTPCQQLRDPSSSQLPRSLRKNIQNRKQTAYGNGFPHKSASSAIKQLTR
jgi:hypothetical protein